MPFRTKNTIENEEKQSQITHAELWEDFWHNRSSDEALARLMEVWMPFVHRVLQRLSIHLPSHVSLDDLLQSALIGLYQAIENFDPKHGVSFEAFGYRRIKGAILDELRAMDRVSRTSRAQLRKIEQAIQEWLQKHGASPTEEELAEAVDMTPRDLALLLDRAQPWLSLDEVVLEGDNRNVFLREVVADARAIQPDEEAAKSDLRDNLRKAFLTLTPREQKILYLYYYEELRLSEIAAIYDLTEARICQLHALSVARLRAALMQRQ